MIPFTWKLDAAAVVALAAATALTWMLYINPALSRSHREASAAERIVPLRRESVELSRQLAAAQADVIRVRHALTGYEQPCWTDPDRSRRMEKLYALAKSSGLNVEGVEPMEAESVALRRALPIRMTARGPFHATLAALADTRRAMPDIVLRSLDLLEAGGSGRELTVGVEWLWVPPQPDPVTAPSSPAPASTATR